MLDLVKSWKWQVYCHSLKCSMDLRKVWNWEDNHSPIQIYRIGECYLSMMQCGRASYLKKVMTSTSWIFRCVIDVCSVLAGAWSEICLCLTISGSTSVLLCFKRIGFPHIVPSETHPLGGGVPAEYPWKRLWVLLDRVSCTSLSSSQSYNTNMDGLNDVQWNVCRRGEVSQPWLMCPSH